MCRLQIQQFITKNNDILSYEKGCHEIDGDRLFVNVVEYTTTTPEERFWEAHKNYLDIHVMLKGTEQIDLNFIQNMELKEFVEKDDFLPMDGEKNASVIQVTDIEQRYRWESLRQLKRLFSK